MGGRVFFDDDPVYPRTLQFQLGRSTVRATANLIDPFFPHVLKLHLHQNAWQRFVSRRLLPALPQLCQRLIKQWWPRYALPDCVVLKKLAKPEHTHMFENEEAMYKRLARFQGRLIPHFYGEAQCEGARALVVSFVPGKTAREQVPPRLTVEELIDRIRGPAEEMATSGIVYGDAKMSNIILTDDGRVVFIDLEMAEEEPDIAVALENLLDAFEDRYKQYLEVADGPRIYKA
ncbi:Protein kinase-like domain protein [Niveomyces insectorum RCEF 264]|uniref:Protein kinase-like domain protein n=1 Tax=Niveomyces insectorum RCEF 264 TaxID=1081102 RepID=A0A167TGJ5_9HYPO|nr:Protein kinase-like domain protein [Niveomyces insectorum RCEF 264]